ncbi:MAG: SIS domain-containing protein, partial [Syntrophorhabdaceae bacterium]|nr:SIS domain-containing protein [Syntrophorhabdaceae bacterium]
MEISTIKNRIFNALTSYQRLLDDELVIKKIEKAVHSIIIALANGSKLLICGNGGSAADAQHMAGEFVCRFYKDRDPLPAIALTVDTSVITAISNDYAYEQVFSRQVKALGKKGDILLGISTSGTSKNVLEAF